MIKLRLLDSSISFDHMSCESHTLCTHLYGFLAISFHNAVRLKLKSLKNGCFLSILSPTDTEQSCMYVCLIHLTVVVLDCIF